MNFVYPFPAGRISCGSRTEPPDRSPCLGFPSPPPSAGTCEPDCWEAGGESFPREELSAGAAPRETGGGGGASGLPRQARLRLGELGSSSCAAGAEKQVQDGTCSAVAPGVKVNLKPSPSRLSKQRPAQLMNIHYPRNPIPAPLHPPRRQGPPGTAWPGRGNPKGSQGWGEPGSLSPHSATLRGLFAPQP